MVRYPTGKHIYLSLIHVAPSLFSKGTGDKAAEAASLTFLYFFYYLLTWQGICSFFTTYSLVKLLPPMTYRTSYMQPSFFFYPPFPSSPTSRAKTKLSLGPSSCIAQPQQNFYSNFILKHYSIDSITQSRNRTWTIQDDEPVLY